MKHDVVVIGAGVSGVTSALLLARNGYRVALAEKAGRTLPLLRGFSRGGVRFDTGFHYTGGMAEGEPLDVFFRYLGLSGRVSGFPFDDRGFDSFRCVEDAFEFPFPSGYAPIREKLLEAFPGERPAVETYLRDVKAAFDSLPYLNLDVPVDSNGALQRIFGRTLQETLDSLTANRLLKSVLSMHCLLYGVSPEEVSFFHHACIVGSYYLSARGITGGGRSLAEQFDARLAELGVDVRCGDEVAALSVAPGGGLRGVRLKSGEELQSDVVIATVHPRVMLGMAPEGAFRPAYKSRIGSLEDTVSAFMLFSVSDRPIPSLGGRNLFVFPDADCIHDLGSRPLEKSPLYVTAAYPVAGGAPRGFIGIFPAKAEQTREWEDSISGKRPAGYGIFKKEVVSRMEGIVRMYCPQLGGTMRHTEGSTPLTLRDFNHSPSGGLYGVKHKVGQYNPGPLTRMKGLLLAGQAVASPGILGAVLSGFLACGNLLGHDRLIEGLRECR